MLNRSYFRHHFTYVLFDTAQYLGELIFARSETAKEILKNLSLFNESTSSFYVIRLRFSLIFSVV